MLVGALAKVVKQDVVRAGAKLADAQSTAYALSELQKEAQRCCKVSADGHYSAALSIRVSLFTLVAAVFRGATSALSEPPADSSVWNSLVQTFGIIFDAVIGEPKHAAKPQSSVKSALVLARRTLRESHTMIPSIIDSITANSSANTAIKLAPLLGLACDVALRLKTSTGSEKGQEGGVGRSYIESKRDSILAYYTNHILPSKTPVPAQAATALGDFFTAETDDETVATKLRPTMEKLLLRSPEVSMPVEEGFFRSCKRDTSPHIKSLLPGIVSASKSSVAATRAKAVSLLSLLVERAQDAGVVQSVGDELLSLLKTSGKTASPDQRAALYEVLANFPSTLPVQDVVRRVEAAASLLPKETAESSVKFALVMLSQSLDTLLRRATAQEGNESTSKVAKAGEELGKVLQHAKVPLRRLACSAVGDLLWRVDGSGEAHHREVGRALAEALLPALETNLKNASTNTLTSPSGPLEGYVAVALLEGPLLQTSEKVKSAVAKNAVLQDLLATSPKPSFLLSDKVHRKFTSVEEEIWLGRALQAVWSSKATGIAEDPAALAACAHAILQLALVSLHSTTRREALRAVEACATVQPVATSELVRETAFASAKDETPAHADASEGSSPSRNAAVALRRLLISASKLPEVHSQEEKQKVLENLFLPAHLPTLGNDRSTVFPELCQHAQMDTRQFIENALSNLISQCRNGLLDSSLQAAALTAVTTLATHAPESAIAELVGDIETSIDIARLRGVTEQDIAIFATSPDTTFVDVLADGKDAGAGVDKNRKDAKVEQWEAELRAELAKKKAAQAKTLTKEQKAKVDAQLKIEAETRAQISRVRQDLKRASAIVIALVASGSNELDSYLPSLVRLVRDLLQVPAARQLDEAGLLAAFSALCSCASPRLTGSQLFIEVALLRTISDDLVSESFTLEPLRDQVLRVLYRLRFLSELEPLDLASLASIVPLLSLIISKKGIDIDLNAGTSGQAGDEDAKDNVADSILEQIQLALDIIDFHAGACEDVRFPRAEMIDDLVIIVREHSRLARDAVGALRSLGEAMKDSALPSEIALLLRHTLAQETYVRLGALQAIQSMDLSELEFSNELWLAHHDPDDAENARLAERAWDENGLDVPADFASGLIRFLDDKRAYVRRATGRALAGATELHSSAIPQVLQELYALYRERNKILTPEYDQYGMITESTRNREDPWHVRTSIASALADMGSQLQPTDLEPFFEFMIKDEALGDRSDDVRQHMLDAATLVIDVHGKERLSELITRFEGFLAQPPPASEALDGVLEAVVILLGRLARHLERSDKRIASIVERLLDALKTPSEMVQVAVADCLPALVPAIKGDTPRLVERLFEELLLGAKYAQRRGAAYGLAGIIKGRGISAMSEFGVMQRLSRAIEDKANVNSRQSAVECYGIFAATLQRLFEPYIIEGGVLPQLITAFGDSKAEVRDATEETAKVIMQNVSSYCAKLMMPTLLEGLEEKQWRTKKGAIELLGAYSSAAPAQLASALPTVIPRLSGVLSDAHPQVRASGNRSLKQFGSVMKNPEIKTLVPVLLSALIDPTSKTAAALRKLLAQTFAHYMDAPSLALVVPIVDRGLRDRSAQVQRDGAKITGNLASLTDGRDLRGHLPRLMPLIRDVLVSPVPETRAEAARALGVLVERLGEVQFPDLVPSLMAQLRGETVTGVDRQGAAQGLSEVLAALGMDRLEALLPSVLENTSSSLPHVREGGIALLIYLPGTFGTVRFAPYVSRIVTPILNGLADTSDSVREMSMRAGRMIIGSFSKDAVDLLLPELEQGMFDDTPRIRLSSLQLCSELLFRLSGISGKNNLAGEDDDAGAGGEDGPVAEESVMVSNSVQARLRHALGDERFLRTMATIFCLRQDPAFNVRDSASSTWKAIIVNTAKTMRELLSTVVDFIIRALSRDGDDQKEIASKTLGEITRKLGGSVLEEIVPQLQERGSDPGASASVRAGVMLAVESLLESATDAQLEDHEDALIASVRQGLTDRSAVVREAAASAFDALQGTVGQNAIEEVIPTLLRALQGGDNGGDDSLADTSLAALREVMRTRADVVFPASLPTLLVQPITAFNARALGDLVSVAGSAINKRLHTMLNALSIALDARPDEETQEALQDGIDSILNSVNSFDALHQLMMLLLGWVGDPEKDRRKIVHGCQFFSKFASNLAERGGGRALDDYNADWLRRLATLLDAREEEIVQAALPALAACVESTEDPEELAIPLRHTLSGLSEDVPGLAHKEGFGSCSGVFLAALLSGTGEQKEQAAMGLGVLVLKADPVAIKPFVTTGLAGPLIRACGERHAAAVKAAILNTLDICLNRIPQHLKPFYPQLSRSFLKAAGDPTGLAVRDQAATCLGTMATIVGARLDLNALIAGARSGVAGQEQTTDYPDGSANALAAVLLKSQPGSAQVEAVKADVASLVDAAFDSSEEERFKISIGQVMAGLAVHDAAAAKSLLERRVLPTATDSALASNCISALVDHTADISYDFGHAAKMAKIVSEFVFAGPAIARPAREAREWMKTRNPWASDDAVISVL